MVSDPHNLQRFVSAQAGVYPQVLRELREGEKQSHWMWFIFPQIAGLGFSSMAQRYAIRNAEEARAYLDHATLGQRLRECTALVNAVNNRSVSAIFGYPDDLKFHSCLTLFAQVATAEEPEFQAALNKYFDGRNDDATLGQLKS